MDNNLERQNDLEFVESVLNNREVMVKAVEKFAKEHLKMFPLEHFDEPVRSKIKAEHDRYPKYITLTKTMYEPAKN